MSPRHTAPFLKCQNPAGCRFARYVLLPFIVAMLTLIIVIVGAAILKLRREGNQRALIARRFGISEGYVSVLCARNSTRGRVC